MKSLRPFLIKRIRSNDSRRFLNAADNLSRLCFETKKSANPTNPRINPNTFIHACIISSSDIHENPMELPDSSFLRKIKIRNDNPPMLLDHTELCSGQNRLLRVRSFRLEALWFMFLLVKKLNDVERSLRNSFEYRPRARPVCLFLLNSSSRCDNCLGLCQKWSRTRRSIHRCWLYGPSSRLSLLATAC
jgi:hypothetical protein